MKHRLLLTALLLISINGIAQVKVSGMVIDTRGNPVSGAFVRAVPRGDKRSFVGTFKPDWIIADDLGRFSMKLASGQYRFLAKNERSGFPDPLFSVNHDAKSLFPEVVVGRTRIDRIKLVLSKGGIFVATVIAAHEGTPINEAKVTILDPSDPKAILEIFSDANGHVEFALPSKPLMLKVSAPEFKSVELTKGKPYAMDIGERRAIIVEMEKKVRLSAPFPTAPK